MFFSNRFQELKYISEDFWITRDADRRTSDCYWDEFIFKVLYLFRPYKGTFFLKFQMFEVSFKEVDFSFFFLL